MAKYIFVTGGVVSGHWKGHYGGFPGTPFKGARLQGGSSEAGSLY